MPKGGKRAGAGRKPASPLGLRIPHTIRLSPEADSRVRGEQEERGGTYTEALERLLVRA